MERCYRNRFGSIRNFTNHRNTYAYRNHEQWTDNSERSPDDKPELGIHSGDRHSSSDRNLRHSSSEYGSGETSNRSVLRNGSGLYRNRRTQQSDGLWISHTHNWSGNSHGNITSVRRYSVYLHGYFEDNI